ncbi:glycosyltransferase [Geodermatophilus arenarius]|uniref:Glycosyltransferase n=1 Tax=Geodermatophilus arenarius TaxID=1137990 RepID=A0ABV9LJ33_9ACTN
MGTYNGERYVEEQLRTILEQSLQPAEILVSDDGSTDSTLDVVQKVAATTSVPIRVHQNVETLGFADNFMRAAERAVSEIIAFSDQDDRWLPRKLQAGLEALDRESAVLSTHRVRFIDGDGQIVPPERRSEPGLDVIEPLGGSPWGNFYGFTMMFRASLLERLPTSERGMDVHSLTKPLSHDRWIYFLATTFGRTVILKEVLAEYRQHSGQLYGGEVGRSLKQRIATKLATGRSQSLGLAAVATYRADLLETRSDDKLAQAAADRWRELAAYLTDSAKLYDDDLDRLQRLGVLTAAIRSRAYRPLEHGGLGRDRLAEDAVILAAKLLRRRS